MSLPIEETIADLGNCDKPLLSSRLTQLSNLNSEELELLQQAWAVIEPKRRRQIIYRLVELAEDNFELNFDSIFTSCLKDQDAEVRSKAIEGLWESEEPSLINPLINLLEQDSSEKVQAAAATALGKFAMLAELKKLRSSHTSRVCQALLNVIGDKSKPIEVRRRALEAAAPLSLPQVKKAILEAYQSHNPKLRASAIYAMGRNCDYSWLPMLLKELGSADAEIRYEAAGACGELAAEEAAASVMEIVNDPDTDVQLAAIQALGKIGGSEAKRCLEECLNNPSEVIHQAAEQALDELEAAEDPFSFKI
ncbi:MAG: HEAT repeat domain-containing protein [Dehalococcoidales bacterium]|nr:HEAT repeat domain-containing protein [Dehalococcoidales bacterium]